MAVDAKCLVVEFALTRQIGERLALEAAGDQTGVGLLLIRGQDSLRVREQPDAVFAQHVGQQQFGVEVRGLAMRLQLSNGGARRGLESGGHVLGDAWRFVDGWYCTGIA